MEHKTNKLEKKILIVEDDKASQEFFQAVLGNTFFLDIAKDGVQAVEKCRENDYNLVLMDIRMPNMNGYEATKEIRKFNSEIPIVAVTALDIEEVKTKYSEAGMNDYVRKPIHIESFNSLVESYMK